MASQLAISSGNELVIAHQQISGLEQQLSDLQRTLVSASSTTAQTVTSSGEASASQSTTTTAVSLLEGAFLQGQLSASTTDNLKQLFPIGNIDQMLALSPDLVIVVSNRKDPGQLESPSSVWLVDLKKGQLTKMVADELTGYGNSFRLRPWQSGAQLDVETSPGEAIGAVRSLYINQSGKVIAESEAGDFNRDGATLSFVLGSTKTDVRLKQTSDCVGGNGLGDVLAPTTTLTGLVVNGKERAFPLPFEAQCEPGYGGEFIPVSLPPPNFDGKQFSFTFPGHSAIVSASGVTALQNAPDSYSITCATGYEVTEDGQRLPSLMSVIHEDATGDHVVVRNIWKDSALASVADGMTCFAPLERSGGIVHFNLKTFEQPSIGRVDYDIASKTFENLVVTTSTKTQ